MRARVWVWRARARLPACGRVLARVSALVRGRVRASAFARARARMRLGARVCIRGCVRVYVRVRDRARGRTRVLAGVRVRLCVFAPPLCACLRTGEITISRCGCLCGRSVGTDAPMISLLHLSTPRRGMAHSLDGTLTSDATTWIDHLDV